MFERADISKTDIYDNINNSENIVTAGNIKILQQKYCPVGSTAVSYTDDLELLVVGQENGSVQLFGNGEEPRLLYDYEMLQEAQPCTDIKVRASPKNGFHKSVLITYLGGHIKLWDTKICKCLFTMKEKRETYGVTYHPMNNKFITVGNDFKVYLYDEERRTMERILACSEIFGSKNGHTQSVCSAKFHPRNPFEIISCGLDSTIQFWDLRAPYAVRHIPNIINFGEALDISPDGKIILAGVSSNHDGALRIYDYDTGAIMQENYFCKTYLTKYFLSKTKDYTKFRKLIGTNKDYGRLTWTIKKIIYCCKFLTPSFVGIGGFLENSFQVVNINTGEVLGSVNELPGCVMSFALKRRVLQQRVKNKEIPVIAISSGDKVLEIETIPSREEYKSL